MSWNVAHAETLRELLFNLCVRQCSINATNVVPDDAIMSPLVAKDRTVMGRVCC